MDLDRPVTTERNENKLMVKQLQNDLGNQEDKFIFRNTFFFLLKLSQHMCYIIFSRKWLMLIYTDSKIYMQ